jgi:GNAT superfamily N-acetyltransferase
MNSIPLPVMTKIKGVYRNSNNEDNNNNTNTGVKVIDIYSGDESIGLVQYNNNTGEIGMMLIHETFRNMGLGKYILKNIIEEMKQNKVKDVWVISNKHHDFWSNVNSKSFTYKIPVHPTTKYGGFYMKI